MDLKDFDEAFTNLIQQGLVEIVGINKEGELLYQLAENVKIPEQ
jgi:hypothetical protein